MALDASGGGATNVPVNLEAHRRLLDRFSVAVVPITVSVLAVLVLGCLGIALFVAWPYQGTQLPAQLSPEAAARQTYSLSLQAANKFLAVQVLCIASGLILGFLCVFFGAVMSWFGITASVSLEAQGPQTRLALQSASVGVAALVGGVVLVVLSVNKSLQSPSPVEVPSPIPASLAELSTGAAGTGPVGSTFGAVPVPIDGDSLEAPVLGPAARPLPFIQFMPPTPQPPTPQPPRPQPATPQPATPQPTSGSA